MDTERIIGERQRIEAWITWAYRVYRSRQTWHARWDVITGIKPISDNAVLSGPLITKLKNSLAFQRSEGAAHLYNIAWGTEVRVEDVDREEDSRAIRDDQDNAAREASI